MSRFIYAYFCSFITAMLLVSSLALAVDPAAYIIESASESHYTNGTIKGPLSARGRIDIGLPSGFDVIQNVRINISENYADRTNILSKTASSNLAASPYDGDKTTILFDTGDGYMNYYNITSLNLINRVNVTLDYTNSIGGKDLLPNVENTIHFTIGITPPVDMDDTELYFRIRKNSFSKDSMVLANPTAVRKDILELQDSDSDSYADTLYWKGDLRANRALYITLDGLVASGENYALSAQYVEIDTQDALLFGYTEPTTYTGITIQDRFARGPIREGVRIIFRDHVFVRGTITNKAHEIRYRLTSWSIYNVTDLDNPLASGTVKSPQELRAGETYETDWFEAESTDEHYYVPEFNWQVIWNPSSYSSTYSNSMELPVLYQAGGVIDKSISYLDNSSDRFIFMSDQSRNLGHSNVAFDSYDTSITVSDNYTITGVSVYFSNESLGGNTTDITSGSTITIDGNTLDVAVSDIPSVIGHPLYQNEDIIIYYNATGNVTVSAFTFESSTQSTFITATGTPLSLSAYETHVIPAQYVPPPPSSPTSSSGSSSGGGGGYVASSGYADIDKYSSMIAVGESLDTADVNAIFTIIDTGSKGLGDVTAEIILPYGSTLDLDSVVISVYDKSNNYWTRYPRTSLTILKQPEDSESVRYRVYLKSSEWDAEYMKLGLANDDLYSIDYTAYLSEGANKLTTTLYGFNYYEDSYISMDINSYLALSPAEGYVHPLDIAETTFTSQKKIVGTPVRWLKTLDITNKNNISVTRIFKTDLLPGVLTSHISSGTEIAHELISGNPYTARFTDTVPEESSKTYLVDITTPPVIITGEDYTVELSEDKKRLIFSAGVTLENPSQIDYSDVYLLYDIPAENVISINEGNTELTYESVSDDMVSIRVPEIKKGKSTLLELEYTRTPPLVIVETDRPYYKPGDRANISITFIPKSDMSYTNIQLEISGSDIREETIYTDIIRMTDLRENVPKTTTIVVDIPDAGIGTYYVYATASISPLGSVSGSGEFALDSTVSVVARRNYSTALVIFAVLTILLLIRRIYRERKFKDELDNLKKEVENI